MAPRPIVVRRASPIVDDPQELQLWPVSILLLVLAGVVSGVIVAKSDFADPRWFYNGWVRMGINLGMVAVLLWSSYQLRGRVLMRVQFSLMASLLIHLFLLIAIGWAPLEVLAQQQKPPGERLAPRNIVTLPDYGVPLENKEKIEDELQKPVETPTPRDQPQENERQPIETPPKPVERPREEPQKSETTIPTQTQRERVETSAPRQADQLAGAKLSRQELKAPSPTPQHIPTPQLTAESTPSTARAEAQASAVQKETPQPSAQPRRSDLATPSTPVDQPKVELKRQPTRDQPLPDAPPSTQLARRPVETPQPPTPTVAQTSPAPQPTKQPAKQPTPQPTPPTLESAATSVTRATPTPNAGPARPLDSPQPPTPTAAASSATPLTTTAPQRQPSATQPAPNPAPSPTATPLARASSTATPTTTAAVNSPTTATQPNRSATGNIAPSATTVTRTQASALPTTAAQPTAAMQSSATASTATVTAPEVNRVSRASNPTAMASTPEPAAVSRSAGEAQAAPTTARVSAPAVASAAQSARPSPEAASVAVTRSAPGTAGMTAERNFTNDNSAPASSSANQQASAAAQRAATQQDAPSTAHSPSKAAPLAKSAASSDAPQSAFKAEDVKVADVAGSRSPTLTESSASAAARTEAARAKPDRLQADAGTNTADLAASQTVPATGEARGAASTGGGEPALAASAQPVQLGRATPAGEPTAAVAQVPVGAIASAPGAQSASSGPVIESQSAQATRQAREGSAAGPTAGPSSTEASSAAGGLTSLATGEPARSTASSDQAAQANQAAAPGAASLARATSDAGGPPTTAMMAAGGSPSQNNGQPNAAAGAVASVTKMEAAATGVTRQTATSGSANAPAAEATPSTAPGGGAPPAASAGDPSQMLAGGAGPRQSSRDDAPSPSISGDSERTGLPARQSGEAHQLTGVGPVDTPGPTAAHAGARPAGAGLEAAAGLDGPTRPASSTPVEIAAAEGPGGLASDPSAVIGLPDPRARRQSDVVSQLTARFVLERNQGKMAIDSQSLQSSVPTFALRKEARPQAAQLFGSTPEAEESVEMALAFLARHQSPDGSWSLNKFAEPGPGYEQVGLGSMSSNTAATGLALLAFLGAGYDHQDGKYRTTVKAGLDWLVKHQRPDGDLYSGFNGSHNALWLYSHGIAAIPLCEAYGMTGDPDLRAPAQKALQFIASSQDPRRGGWRYTPRTESDTSVTGWQVMALKSGELSGFVIPQSTYAGVSKWLDFAGTGPGGGPARYAYLPMKDPTRDQAHYPLVSKVMTAEALLMRMYLGWDRNHPALRNGADYLLDNLPPRTMSELNQRDTYYWYYATQVMYQMQGEHWKAWNERLRDLLVNSQVRTGPLAGSWDPLRPTADKWGVQGGRLYVTCMHTLMLEVYYRHLPLFRLSDTPQ